MTKRCIIVFTKNRITTLKQTLKNLQNQAESTHIFILDDSTNSQTKNYISQIYRNNVTHHGFKEQLNELNNFEPDLLCHFIKPLGTHRWNLGYNRNYAILLAKYNGFEEVLFIDDDIIIEEKTLISETFDSLTESNIVGAKINGMADDSVIGHLMRQLGYNNPCFLAGGFLSFKIKSITDDYFLNCYNEDWIWILLQRNRLKPMLQGNVVQLNYNPLHDGINKARIQELGEIIADTLMVYDSLDLTALKNHDFWSKAINNRINVLNKIIDKSEEDSIGRQICYDLLNYHSKMINTSLFVEIFENYIMKKPLWKDLLCPNKNAEGNENDNTF